LTQGNNRRLGFDAYMSTLFHIEVHLPRIVSTRPHSQTEPSMALLITSTRYEECRR